MTLLYAVGGRQRPGAAEHAEAWRHYQAGVIVSVDVETGRLRRELEYVSPPEFAAAGDRPSVVFKTASLHDGHLYVPTETELLVYRLPTFAREGHVSLRCFNDVHHVRPAPDGSLYVAVTGLDLVVQVAPDGTVLREWSAIDEDTWARFDRNVDYRKVPSTKPHRSHPNHVFFLDGDVWVTRCDQHDARCLTRDLPPIPLAAHYIHDGLVRGRRIYFTVVSGEVVEVDADRREVVRRFDLNAIAGGGPPLGWCRGIEVLDDDHVVVGFSRLRSTRWKENVKWVKHRLGGDGTGLRPTRLVMFDLRAERMVWEADLEPAEMNVIFSVHRSPD